jgi:hypothetical protein
VFFAGIGAAWFGDQQPSIVCNGQTQGFLFASNSTTNCSVTTGYQTDSLGAVKAVDSVTKTPCTLGLTVTCQPVTTSQIRQVSGFRLQDGRASYGLGLETFMLGFPIHFDWSWRTLFNHDWEDIVFACTSLSNTGQCISGAEDFRKPRFAVWIGYDF